MYNQGWLNENEARNFPFLATSSLYNNTRRVRLPLNFVVDCFLFLSHDYKHNVYLSRVVYSPEQLSLYFSVVTGKTCLVGTVKDVSQSNFLVNLTGEEKYLGSSGKVVVASLESLPYGDFSFLVDDTTIEPTRVAKLGIGVSSINGITEGNVVLKEGANTTITKEGKVIKIETTDGRCACDSCPCIKTINSLKPIGNNFNIRGVGCASITQSEDGITYGNTCENACCDCDDLEAINAKLLEFERRLAALES